MTLLDPPAESQGKPNAIKIYDDCRSFGGHHRRLVYVPVLSGEEKPLTIFLMHSVCRRHAHAYQLLEPSDSYKMGDFLADWGPRRLLRPGKKLRKSCAPLRTEEIEWRHHKRPPSARSRRCPERMTQKRAAAPKWFPFGWIPISKAMSFFARERPDE